MSQVRGAGFWEGRRGRKSYRRDGANGRREWRKAEDNRRVKKKACRRVTGGIQAMEEDNGKRRKEGEEWKKKPVEEV